MRKTHQLLMSMSARATKENEKDKTSLVEKQKRVLRHSQILLEALKTIYYCIICYIMLICMFLYESKQEKKKYLKNSTDDLFSRICFREWRILRFFGSTYFREWNVLGFFSSTYFCENWQNSRNLQKLIH